MKRLWMILLVCALTMPALLLMPGAASASPTVTIYAGDFSGWQAAVNNVYDVEDFEDASLNPGVSIDSDLGEILVDYGLWWDQLNYSGGPTSFTTWTFAVPIYAFGGTWDAGSYQNYDGHPIGGPGSNIEVLIGGVWVSVGVIDREYIDVFWGFVSDVPFTQVRLQAYNDEGWTERYTLDNMVYSIARGVKIISPSDGDTFWIEAEPTPTMPTVNCQAKIIGITPDPTAVTQFTWDYEVNYNPSQQSEYGPDWDISYNWPPSTSAGGTTQLNFRNIIRGGDLTIGVTVTIDGCTYSDTITVTILARNPSVDAIKSQLGDNHVLWRIASRESDFTQFLTDGYPLWSHDKLGGVGIMQLTPPSSDDQIWDWTENCKGGQAKLQYGFNIANRWHTTVENSLDFRNLVDTYNQLRVQQGLQPLKKISVPKLTAGDFNENVQQREKAAIRIYNGCAGSDPYLPNLPLHEYRIDVVGGILHVENINEKALTGKAVWVRVPAAERPQGVGDPNYVEHVLNEPLP